MPLALMESAHSRLIRSSASTGPDPKHEQSARLEHKQPGLTVGCLVEKLRIDALLDIIRSVVESAYPQEQFKKVTESMEDYRPVRISSKHMAGRELGRMMPTASLKYRLPEYQTLAH